MGNLALPFPRAREVKALLVEFGTHAKGGELTKEQFTDFLVHRLAYQVGTRVAARVLTQKIIIPAAAVALNVANKWADQFQDLIADASASAETDNGSRYHPDWCHGSAWNASSLGATSPSSSSGNSGGDW